MSLLHEKYVSSHFSQIHKPENLEKGYRLYSKYYRYNFRKFLPANKNAKILEIAPGMGHFQYFLKTSGYRDVTGVDVSEECVDVCTEMGFKNIVHMDSLEFLEKCEEKYDAIVSIDFIEHLKKDQCELFLRLSHSRLNRGGILMLKTFNGSHPLLAVSNFFSDFTHRTGFTESSLKALFLANGFNSVNCMAVKRFVFYKNPLNYFLILFQSVESLFFKAYFLIHGRGLRHREKFSKDIAVTGYK